jgi:hypothetical protein
LVVPHAVPHRPTSIFRLGPRPSASLTDSAVVRVVLDLLDVLGTQSATRVNEARPSKFIVNGRETESDARPPRRCRRVLICPSFRLIPGRDHDSGPALLDRVSSRVHLPGYRRSSIAATTSSERAGSFHSPKQRPIMVKQNPVGPNVAVPSSQRPRPNRHLSSLREYLDALRDLGELQEIAHEVDWNLEIGAVTRRCYETGAPAPLFGRVKGAEPGFRVLALPQVLALVRANASPALPFRSGCRREQQRLRSWKRCPALKTIRLSRLVSSRTRPASDMYSQATRWT